MSKKSKSDTSIINRKELFKQIQKFRENEQENMADVFPYFCLKIFWELEDDEIEDAISGLSSDDEGIDAYFSDEGTKEIHIIQCKSCKSHNNIQAAKKDWFSFINDIESKLEDDEFIRTHRNPRILDIASDFSEKNKLGFKVKKHFFHLGAADPKIIKFYRKSLQYYSVDDIQDEYEEYLSKLDRTEPPEISIELKFDIIDTNFSSNNNTLISIITGDQLINLREKHRYKLFDKNLRFGLDKSKINKNIVETIKSEPNRFYFYNNGITIMSQGYRSRETNGTVRIHYPQIINGAQTVTSIYNAFNKAVKERCVKDGVTKSEAKDRVKEEYKKINILFRIIQNSKHDGKKLTEFEQKIIRYNNTQNPIKETDFYANNPEQIELQRKFCKFGYFYELKRGDRDYLERDKKNSHTLLDKSKKDFKFWEEKKLELVRLASLWMAYKFDPNLDKIKKSTIFGYAKDKNYEMLFPQDVDDRHVQEMILAFHLFNLIEIETKIYASAKKTGQIISRLTKFNDNSSEKDFIDLASTIQNSLLSSETINACCENKNDFMERKDDIKGWFEDLQFFSLGKYMVLHVFRLIIDKCDYLDKIIEYKMFNDKKFLKREIFAPWIKIILEEIIKPEYEKFKEKSGGTIQTFYSIVTTTDSISKSFKRLDFNKNKKFKDIFPLIL